jgi:hypothetical protein
MAMKICLPAISCLLGVTTAPAYALDPPTGRGYLQYGQQRYELRYAQAVGGEMPFGAGGENSWERLMLGDKRILGTVRLAKEAGPSGGAPAWAFEVIFNAPIFSSR